MRAAESLVAGEAYYRLGFVDARRTVIDIQTYIFIGKNVFNDTVDTWYFQDPGSFAQVGSFVDAATEARTIHSLTFEELHGIFDLHDLRDELARLS